MHKNRYLIAFLLVLLLSSIYVFVFSESGVLERYMLESREAGLLKKNEALKKENLRLRKKLNSLASGEVSEKDFSTSGVKKPGSRVLVLDDTAKKDKPQLPPGDLDDEELPLMQMRIIWIVMSLLVMFLYFNRIYRNTDSPDDVL